MSETHCALPSLAMVVTAGAALARAGKWPILFRRNKRWYRIAPRNKPGVFPG